MELELEVDGERAGGSRRSEDLFATSCSAVPFTAVFPLGVTAVKVEGEDVKELACCKTTSW